MGLLRTIRLNKLARQLKCNAAVLENLKSDHGWPENALQGGSMEICATTLSLEDFSSFTCERLAPHEFIGELGRLVTIAHGVLKAAPAIVVGCSEQCIQAVFSPQFSGTSYFDTAVQTGQDLYNRLNSAMASETVPLARPRISVAKGRVIAGIIRFSGSVSYSFTGRAMVLSRLLASEHLRYGEPILVDNEAGRNMDMARPLDLYRLPGFEEVHTLYAPPDPARCSSEMIDLFGSGLAALYLDNDPEKAAGIFKKCIEADDHYPAAEEMLAKCGQQADRVKMRAFRAL